MRLAGKSGSFGRSGKAHRLTRQSLPQRVLRPQAWSLASEIGCIDSFSLVPSLACGHPASGCPRKNLPPAPALLYPVISRDNLYVAYSHSGRPGESQSRKTTLHFFTELTLTFTLAQAGFSNSGIIGHLSSNVASWHMVCPPCWPDVTKGVSKQAKSRRRPRGGPEFTQTTAYSRSLNATRSCQPPIPKSGKVG